MVGGRVGRREEWERRVDPACECCEGLVGESRMRGRWDGWDEGGVGGFGLETTLMIFF